jgi:AraC-like DNA-binding protein
MTIARTETPRRSIRIAADRREMLMGAVARGAADSEVLGPAPPPAWAGELRQLTHLARAPVSPPCWWTPGTAFCGNLETRTNSSRRHLDGMHQPKPDGQPAFRFMLGLAGWGHFDLDDEQPRKITPGKGCFALAPSRHRHRLPPESPGWTFAWIEIQSPLLSARVASQVKVVGPFVEVEPEQTLTRAFLRLVRGAIKKDFRDRFDVELAMWEFVLAYERWAHAVRDGSSGGQRLLDEVRTRIVAGLPRAIGVEALAAEYGMSRSHFSHYFRTHTGLTPAHFAVEVRIHEAARLLRETRSPLKVIASTCGFANANHFSKVFRRYRHTSPPAYRRATG